MRFRTEIDLPFTPLDLNPDSGITLLGSCFSDNIGKRLGEHGINVCVNPCGVLFNPLSIAAVIAAAMDKADISACDFEFLSLHRNWLFSTKFAHPEPMIARAIREDALSTLRARVRGCSLLIVTFGTARVYTHIPSALSSFSGVVGNCHKVPKEFDVRRVNVAEIVARWTDILEKMYACNPTMQVMMTVSPIRHLSDGAHENTLSKATLHLAIEELQKHFPGIIYFPAYELLNDDLRDYRFYAADMAHPSEQAVDYIWEKLLAAHFPAALIEKMKQQAAELRRLRHQNINNF